MLLFCFWDGAECTREDQRKPEVVWVNVNVRALRIELISASR